MLKELFAVIMGLLTRQHGTAQILYRYHFVVTYVRIILSDIGYYRNNIMLVKKKKKKRKFFII